MNIGDLSTEELKALVREAVEDALAGLLLDPDEGLKLREEVKARLKASMADVDAGATGVPLEGVMERIERAR